MQAAVGRAVELSVALAAPAAIRVQIPVVQPPALVPGTGDRSVAYSLCSLAKLGGARIAANATGVTSTAIRGIVATHATTAVTLRAAAAEAAAVAAA